jgi:hypothetical protein
MNQNENPPTVLWIEYVFDNKMVRVSLNDPDVEEILYAGPGMAMVKHSQNVFDQIISDQMVCRLKKGAPKDAPAKIITKDMPFANVDMPS